MSERVMAAMSGGVDSSVAASLLLDAGYDVSGGTMRLNGLAAEEVAVGDAAAVCDRLGIPHFVFDKRREFKDRVVSFFAKSYMEGLTPNPCVFCNRHLKFPEFIVSAAGKGYTRIATGHYARVGFDTASERWVLKKGLDAAKDQSYFLFGLTQDMLSRVVFPLGELTKRDVREMAQELGLPSAERPDSQDVCFLEPGQDYMAFLRDRMGYIPNEGEFIDRQGRVIGRHQGAAGYTTGQRRGLGVSSGGRLYVLGKDMGKNTVTLGPPEALMTDRVHVDKINFVSIAPQSGDFTAQVKLRYSRDSIEARVIMTGPDTALLELREPKRRSAPGQAAVFYDGDTVLGGGMIV